MVTVNVVRDELELGAYALRYRTDRTVHTKFAMFDDYSIRISAIADINEIVDHSNYRNKNNNFDFIMKN